MIVRDLYIGRYDWHLKIFYAVDCYYTGEIIDELKAIRCPRPGIERAYRNLSSCRLNTGLTCSNHALPGDRDGDREVVKPGGVRQLFLARVKAFHRSRGQRVRAGVRGRGGGVPDRGDKTRVVPGQQAVPLLGVSDHDREIRREICKREP